MPIRPFRNNKWRADAGMIFGKRQMRVFATQAEAKLWLRQMDRKRQDIRIGVRRLSADQEQFAVMSFEMLKKHNFADPDSILDAVRRFVSLAFPSSKKTLREALINFERDLVFANRSPVYVSQIIRQLNRFVREFAAASIHEITPDQIKDWLEANCASPANRANRMREIKVFFSWAVKQRLTGENPVDRISKITVDYGRPDILTLAQVQSALENLKGEDRALFTVMTFAGLRPSEAEELHWEDVKLERGFLEAKRGVRADNRNVRLSANLIAWLKPLATEGLVFKGHTRRWRDRVQRAIAIGAEPLPVWPQDVLRHTFGSYHLEAHKDASNTAYEMGHRGNPQMLFRHYRELVTPEDAQAFWKIMP